MKRRRQSKWQRPLTALLLFFALATGVWAQVTVTGTVSDATGAPLPGVNVTIKGTTTGTITDLDGNYEINVPSSSDILVFSMVGMLAEEITVGDQTTISTSLAEDVVGLDEIVVVGYGTMKKSDVTGSIVSLKEEEFSQVKTTNVVEGLQGKAAGVDISRSSGEAGSGFDINIRGQRSLSGSNDPLYIVDGIQYGGGIDINPSDIASIEILKDVSSTAIYGSKGANGVVIITTKKGFEGKTKVNFSAYYGVNSPLGSLPYMTAQDFIDFKLDMARFDEWDSDGGDADAVWNEGLTVDDIDWEDFETEGIANGTDTRWIDEVMRRGTTQNYFLSVNGGKKGFTYNLSADYTNEEGMLKQDDFKRYVIRAGFDAKVTDFLNVGTNSILSYKDRSRMDFPSKRIRLMNPLAAPYDSTGALITQPTTSSDQLTPLWYFQDGYYDEEELKGRIFSSVYADVKILEGLHFKTTFNADLSMERNGLSEKASEDDTNVEVYLEPAKDITWSNVLSYDKTWGVHSLQLTGVYEFMSGNVERYRISGINPAVPDSKWYALDSMDEISVSLDEDEDGDDAYTYTEGTTISYMARANYTLMGKYMLAASVRTDGASQLSEGNKWSTFPAVSMGWNLREEEFIKTVDFISLLKLRAGYGVSGNYSVPKYSSISSTNVSPLYYEFGADETVYYGYRASTTGNSSLTWERTASYNVGLDFGFADNRISGNFDVFKANTTDLLQQRNLPAHAAISSIYDNVGEVETSGIEVMLHTINISQPGSGFKWSSDISFSRTKEEIVELGDGILKDEQNGWFVGEPIEVFYDYEKAGIWQLSDAAEMELYEENGFAFGDIKLVDNDEPDDHIIDESDRVVLGTPRPDWYGSFNNRFDYKGFDFSLMIMARMGQMIEDDVMTQSQVTDAYEESGMEVDYWTPVNGSNESPRLGNFSSISYYPYASTLRYTDGSWVKVRDITLGYSLPHNLLDKMFISSFRCYVSLKNYFVLYSPYYQKGRYDPEMEGSTNWPVPKTAMIGVNLEF